MKNKQLPICGICGIETKELFETRVKAEIGQSSFKWACKNCRSEFYSRFDIKSENTKEIMART